LAARERSMLRAQNHQDVIRAAIREALDLGLEPGRKWVESAARKEGFSLLDSEVFEMYQRLLYATLAQTEDANAHFSIRSGVPFHNLSMSALQSE